MATLWARLRPTASALANSSLHLRTSVGRSSGWKVRAASNAGPDFGRRRTGKGADVWLPAQHLTRDEGHGVDVRRRRVSPFELLRCHVAYGSHDHDHRRVRREVALVDLRDAEVDELHGLAIAVVRAGASRSPASGRDARLQPRVRRATRCPSGGGSCAARAGGSGPCDSASRKLTPSTCWMTRNGDVSSSSPTSRIPMTPECSMRASAFISCSKRDFSQLMPTPFGTHHLDDDRAGEQDVGRAIDQRLTTRAELRIDAIAVLQQLSARRAAPRWPGRGGPRADLRGSRRPACPMPATPRRRRGGHRRPHRRCEERGALYSASSTRAAAKSDVTRSQRSFTPPASPVARRGLSPSPGPRISGSVRARLPPRAR